MNKKIIASISIVSIFAIFLCACSKSTDDISMTPESNLATADSKTVVIDTPKATPSSNLEASLPEGFTIDKIKNALLEYINYRLWLYPAEIQETTSDKDFDNYIDKSIDVEIRVYNDKYEKSVYAQTNVGKWLAIFKNSNGFVYCDGQVSEDEKIYPKSDDYQVIEKYSVKIPKPHKPNYGTSPRKDMMIALLESTIKSSCEEYYSVDKAWANVNVYIADFYEYEMAAHAWLCREDGYISNYPVKFIEENGQLKVLPLKGYAIEGKGDYREYEDFWFQRDIKDAVKNFKCNVE